MFFQKFFGVHEDFTIYQFAYIMKFGYKFPITYISSLFHFKQTINNYGRSKHKNLTHSYTKFMFRV